jgi:hypothetical protein
MYASNDGNYYMQVDNSVITGEQTLEYLNEFGDQGWELVSVVQKVGNEIFYDPKAANKTGKSAGEIFGNLFNGMMVGPAVTTSTQYKTATIGYSFWFKRPKE